MSHGYIFIDSINDGMLSYIFNNYTLMFTSSYL